MMVDRHNVDGDATTDGEFTARPQDGLMFGCAHAAMFLRRRAVVRVPSKNECESFCRTARKDDLGCISLNKFGDFASGRLNCFRGIPAEGMVATRRVPPVLGVEREHLVEDSTIDRSGS